jgi:hypothetical protein
MSHFTRIKTQLIERDYLTRALADLGYSWEEGTVEVRGYAGNRAQVDLRVPTRTPGYDIGFQKCGDAYELVADWWGIKDVVREPFLRKLTQRYAYHAARAQLEQQGFALVSEEQSEVGQIHLLLRRMG